MPDLRRRVVTGPVLGVVLGVALLAAGCVSLPGSDPVSTFQLRAAGDPSDAASSEPRDDGVVVAVERPVASGAVAGDRLVVEVDGELQFVSGARWEDDLPELLALEIARALQETEGIDAVDAAQKAGRAGFGLITAIERMQVELEDDYSGVAVTEITARLVRLPARDIIATSEFRGEAPAADDSPDTLAEAISAATREALTGLTAWVGSHARQPSG
jgi:ABC-type uncharacterized transport system auxiliary subunit